jgi:type I restriction enzyme R subunit
LRKPGTDDRDRFQQHLANIVISSTEAAAATNARPVIQRVNGGDICRVHVDPCGFPVEATVLHDKNGQHWPGTP